MTHPFQRTALILLAGGAIGAYGSAAAAQLRPNFPTRLEDLPRAEAPAQAPQEDAPIAAGTPGPVGPRPVAVQSRPLAPLAAARKVQEEDVAAPATRTETHRSVTGRVVDVEGRAETYTVKSGDTLTGIARKLDTTVAQLRDDNGIKGSNIRPGQKLKGPKTRAKAYVVVSGDTLSAVARRFGVTLEALREENGRERGEVLRTGERIRLPEGYRDRGPITTTTRVTEPAAAPSPSRPPARASEPEPDAEAPAERASSTRLVTGRVIEVEGAPRTYTVKKGDTLEEIAGKLDTTVSALKKDNRLKSSVIRPGQKLKGPPSTAKAYVAVSGDTLATIGRRFGVSAEAVRRANGLNRNAPIRAGQRIRLPSGYRDRGPIAVTAPATPPRRIEPLPPAPAPETAPPPRREEPPAGLPSRPQPYTPSRPAPGPSGGPPAAPVAAPPPSDSAISAMGRGRFVWPVRGDIISDFGPKRVGQSNDGVNIRAPAGEPVRSAAAGEVVYAGDQVPGFGNLVLIKHEDGWVTAYGHLARVDVKMQQKITQGQQIGQVGSTGGVAEPQLHFEVRYAPNALERARPVDPTLVLPR